MDRRQLTTLTLSCCLATALCCVSGAGDPGVASFLISISPEFNLDVFLSNGSVAPINASSEFSHDENASLPLRVPCPSCDASYNILPLSSHRALVADSEKLDVVSVSRDFNSTFVHVREINAHGCSPLSVVQPQLFNLRNYLYVVCNSTADSGGYFIARVFISDERMSFERFRKRYDNPGIFYSFYDRDYRNPAPDMFYVYEAEDLLFFISPDDGKRLFFPLPDNCTHIVRMTSLGAESGEILVECSSHNDHSTVSMIHIFSLEQGEFTIVMRNLSYNLCPLRVSNNRSILALFAGGNLILKRLASTEREVSVEAHGAIYDGQLAEFDDAVIAVYSTSDGLYKLDVGVALGEGTTTPTRLNGSERIRAQEGSPLLLVVQDRKVVATFEHRIAIFSLKSNELVGTIETAYQPSRFFFHDFLSAVQILPSCIPSFASSPTVTPSHSPTVTPSHSPTVTPSHPPTVTPSLLPPSHSPTITPSLPKEPSLVPPDKKSRVIAPVVGGGGGGVVLFVVIFICMGVAFFFIRIRNRLRHVHVRLPREVQPDPTPDMESYEMLLVGHTGHYPQPTAYTAAVMESEASGQYNDNQMVLNCPLQFQDGPRRTF